MSKQIRFVDLESHSILGGIMLDNGDVLCGCCGGIISSDEINDTINILKVYETWVDLSPCILGDDFYGET